MTSSASSHGNQVLPPPPPSTLDVAAGVLSYVVNDMPQELFMEMMDIMGLCPPQVSSH